ncbi:hypothetical protein M011DRAFT_460915 [Sporormia fimetaria CBS 119925]|uniref:Uncharacterized protein n=1 Tax=Sporormia fimetaria CBS 119925 TaxID=1340428 RepID=A0A6A6V1M2_9PLEO|nr:hypothetical protein M011DRAFT_460915 [Sporormia fimetaria CBS 119925]
MNLKRKRSSDEPLNRLPPRANKKAQLRRKPALRKPAPRPQQPTLEEFADDGGPDLSDLRNYSMGSSRSSKSTRSRSSTSTAKPGPYDPSFEQILIDSHIYSPAYTYSDGTKAPQPANLKHIQTTLARPHASVPYGHPLDEEFAKFTKRANPDVYYGSRPETVDRTIRKDARLAPMVVPASKDNGPIVPNYCLGLKGPAGTPGVLIRQAVYDGAHGARAIHALSSYGMEDPIFDNNAYTLSGTGATKR